jgi:hypothetical protein
MATKTAAQASRAKAKATRRSVDAIMAKINKDHGPDTIMRGDEIKRSWVVSLPVSWSWTSASAAGGPPTIGSR